MNLDIVKRLEDEANFCMKNPRYCSIRTFDILEDARCLINGLQAKLLLSESQNYCKICGNTLDGYKPNKE